MILDSEKASDLKEGIIALTSTMKRPSEIFVSVDNSPGFKNLLTNFTRFFPESSVRNRA